MKNQNFIIFFSVVAILIFVFAFYRFDQKRDLDETPIEGHSSLIKKGSDLNNFSTDSDLGTHSSREPQSIKSKILTKTKSGQMVVDQTLKRSNFNGEGEGGSEKIEIENEIILVDGATNQVLKNYSVVLNFTFDNISADKYSIVATKLNSDINGKIIFKTEKAGILNLLIFSDEYAVFVQKILVGHGKNEYKAKLYKGGILEIHAINTDNEIVKDLSVAPQNWMYDNIVWQFKPLTFDAQKGLYSLINLLGTNQLAFEAEGYISTKVYQINIAPNQKSYLEVRFQRPRRILLSLDLDSKPEQIKVSNCLKTNSFDGEEELQKEESRAQKIDLTKNKNNMYEYQLFENDVSGLVVYVEGCISQVVRFVPQTDIYHLHLEKSFEGKIKVINEKGSTIVGAEILYFVAPMFEDDRKDFNGGVEFSHFNPEPIKTITGDNGIAILKNLKENMNLHFSVSHLEFLNANFSWEFDAEKENFFTITLSESINISGKIMYAEKPVLGAKVFLFDKNYENPQEKMETNEEGDYSFKYSKNDSAQNYLIKAFHQKYGVGVVSLESKDFSKPIDIYLAKEKSIFIKLEDEKGLPLPNKSMSIVNSNLSHEYIFSSNQKGEYEFFNLEHGRYLLRSNEDALVTTGSESISFIVPSKTLIVGLEKRDLKKVKVKLPNGEIYKGQLNVTIFVGYNIRYDFIYDNNGDRFLDFSMGPEAIYTLDAPGYAPIFLGPYANPSKIPSEFNLELQKGETLKIFVVDSLDNKPLPYVAVTISNDYGIASTLPTNQNGEVIFSNLNAIYRIYVKEYDYVRAIEKVDVAQKNEMEIRLIHCGRLKCISKPNRPGGFLCFRFRDVTYILDANGNVELDNIEPGQYPFTILEMGGNKSDDISEADPTVYEIVIESNKTTEINLDKYLEK